jgi:hypothetical protein
MIEQQLIKDLQQSASNYSQGCNDAEFARESGSLKLLAAIHKVAWLRLYVFKEKNK